MSQPRRHSAATFAPILAVVLSFALGGCNLASRLAAIGEPPALSRIEDPTTLREYRPVALPMPPPESVVRHANSLWRPGARQFFKDQRARRIGDILTVNVNIKEKAALNNSTERSRNSKETADLPAFLGYEGSLSRILPNAIAPQALIDLGSDSGSKGSGKIEREETISLKVAAVVTQILPNGNLVIQGRQEVRVNYEVRELMVTGVVRPEDIASTNSVNHTQIAEARIAYGGRGQVSDLQQPRYGQQLFDIVFPW
jgi:flagellar L-ring protein precursor FlgH